MLYMFILSLDSSFFYWTGFMLRNSGGTGSSGRPLHVRACSHVLVLTFARINFEYLLMSTSPTCQAPQ